MDEADIYYVDTGNADAIVVSRTSGGIPVPVQGGRPVYAGTSVYGRQRVC